MCFIGEGATGGDEVIEFSVGEIAEEHPTTNNNANDETPALATRHIT
jgi:hypothetical protein